MQALPRAVLGQCRRPKRPGEESTMRALLPWRFSGAARQRSTSPHLLGRLASPGRWLAALAIVCCFTSYGLANDKPKRPNVIMILADDLGWGDVGFNGRKDYRTPNLDRFARQGMRFTRWYTAAVVCAPSRAALMTGKYTIHNRVVLNNEDLPRDEVTMAAALRQAGYTTALFGKWHHGKPRPPEKTYVHPLDRGFDEFFGYTNAKHAWEKYPKKLWDGRELKDVKGYADTLFTDRSIDFLKRNRDRPFFLYLAYVAPHLHVEAPPEDVALYKGKFKEKDEKKPVNASYAAMITRLDKEIGRLLMALDDLGLAEDTVVLFSSDHGATFEVGNAGASNYHDSNRPFRGQKRTLWEGGIRVPALVRWPGHIPAGKTSDVPMHMCDVFPTVLAAAGVKVNPKWQVDGRNMLPVWEGKEQAPQRTLFWEWRGEGYYQIAAMRGPIKFIITGVKGRPEMYDVVADPGERRNIVAEHPALGRELEQELRAWLKTQRP
jgi:arylsulfatase A-like enzyme